MKKTLSLTALFFMTIFVFGQSNPDQHNKSHPTVIPQQELSHFVDSLKTKIISDSSKFKRTDLIHTVTGSFNAKPYSPLYIVDGKYLYKLDIINGKNVLEFVKEYLDPTKIESIAVMDSVGSTLIFGRNASVGSISIQIKNNTPYNPFIAGLKTKDKSKDKSFWQRFDGENFWQRGKGDPLLHD